MEKKQINDFMNLTPRKIAEVRTELGFMQVLEYVLQDCSYLHVVQSQEISIVHNDLPNVESKVFFRAKDDAFKYAYEIGKKLLQNI